MVINITPVKKKIYAVQSPEKFKAKNQQGSSEILIMSLAKGKPLGDIMKNKDPDEILLLYTAIKSFYEEFLYSALAPDRQNNFYHGDLHRENIFFDLSTKN